MVRKDPDTQIEHVYHFLQTQKHHPDCAKGEYNGIRKAAKKFILGKGQDLFYIGTDGTQKRLVIRGDSDRERVLRECHNDPTTGGHRGIIITQRKVEAAYYWNGITESVKSWIKHCDKCQRIGQLKTVIPELHPIKTDGCWQVLGMDLIGPLAETDAGNKYVCTLTDLFSKFVYAEAIPSKEASSIAKVVRNLSHLYGPPGRIITDQGREFNNELNKDIFILLGIKHSVTSAYHPQANGQDERTNQSLKRGLAKYCNEDQNDWDEFVKPVVYSINTSYQRSTKHTPYEILFKRVHQSVIMLNQATSHDDPNSESVPTIQEALPEAIDEHMATIMEHADKLNAKIKESIAVAQDRQKKKYYQCKKKGVNSFNFSVADQVLRKNLWKLGRKGNRLESDWLGPYQIVDITSAGQVTLSTMAM